MIANDRIDGIFNRILMIQGKLFGFDIKLVDFPLVVPHQTYSRLRKNGFNDIRIKCEPDGRIDQVIM